MSKIMFRSEIWIAAKSDIAVGFLKKELAMCKPKIELVPAEDTDCLTKEKIVINKCCYEG